MKQFGAWTLWIGQPDFKTAVFWGYKFEVWVALELQASDLVSLDWLGCCKGVSDQIQAICW